MRELVKIEETNDTQSFSDGARKYFRMPGVVTAYYPPVQGVSPPAVDVQPAVHDVRFDTTTGARYSEPWPILHRIPVRFPTFGGFALWGPLKAGDKVDLESFDLDPGPYLSSGQASDPAMTRRNGGAHWVACPGSYCDPDALPDPGSQICFGSPGGVIVSVDGSHVNLGSNPTDAVALASLVKTELTEIKQALASLSCPNTGTGSPVPVVAGTPYTGPANIASGTVKCQP